MADGDLGSTAPALLPDGTVFQVGKSSTGYLLRQTALGGIGGQLASASACSGNSSNAGGHAVAGSVVYVPCGGGVEAVQTNPSPASVSVLWTAASEARGPPITAGGLVWSILGGTLFGINPSDGATVQQLSIGAQANHFPTPSVGDGLLLAPSADQVFAFSGSFGLPGPPSQPPPDSSYWLVASDGGIFSFGNAQFFGSTGALALNKPVVAMAATPDGGGYYLVAQDGGVFAFGDAAFAGSMGGQPLVAPVVGMAVDPAGGYWEVAQDGGVFAFGAPFHGSMGAVPLDQPIVGIAATPDGGGYYLVAQDGGVFAFGDAGFFGSMGGRPLAAPVVGMAATHDGRGYWLVASDGGIFSFGDAAFAGSMGGQPLVAPVVGMAATPDGGGYWLLASDGGIFSFGDARVQRLRGRYAPEQADGRNGRDAALSRQPLVAVSPRRVWSGDAAHVLVRKGPRKAQQANRAVRTTERASGSRRSRFTWGNGRPGQNRSSRVYFWVIFRGHCAGPPRGTPT